MRWLLPLLLLLLSTPAPAASVEVQVTGAGTSYTEAVANGLVEAIQQVTGVAVDAKQEMQSVAAAAAVNDNRVVSMANVSQEAIQRTANGVVRSYRVLETEADEPAHVVLQMAVVVEKFEAKGLDGAARRRIAVAAFAASGGARAVADPLRDHIAAYLTQARRFAVLDRSEEAAYSQEMALLQREAPATERIRIGQVIGADYIVTGTIRHAGVSRSDRTIALTGERIVSAASSLEIDWQVLEIATRQIKWAGTERLQAGGAALSSLLDRAASGIADGITQAIYPMRLIDVSDPNALVINQGAGTVHPGQQLRAMQLGKQMIDPYTKEALGRVEHEVAVVQVQRVDNKLSYARLLSGSVPASGADVVLRPEMPQVRHVPAPRTAPVVVKLPGDP